MQTNRFNVHWIWKFPLLVLEIFWALLTVYVLIALIGMFIQVGDDYVPQKNGVQIFIRTDGIHTDFILPVKNHLVDWSEFTPWNDLRGKDTSFSHVAFGWGDQGFFLNTPDWADLKFSTAFDALFYRGKSAIHVVYQSEPTPNLFCETLLISEKQYTDLVGYIKSSFNITKSGNSICIKDKGYWDFDAFYQAHGKYSLFSTCNSWINGGLKSAHLPACLWTPLSVGILEKYD